MDALRADPRLATLPLAARMVFLLLAEAAAETQETGWIPFAEPRRIALLIRCTETEAETHLETLIAEGLILAERGGLGVPIVREAADRAAVARRNGAAGGRPRKGETPQQAYARRQGSLPLPIAGGKPSETQHAKPAAPTTTTTTTTSTSSGGGVTFQLGKETESIPGSGKVVCRAREAETQEWVSLGVEVAELAGLDGARGGFDYRPVQAWLNAGYPAEAIRAAVERIAARPGYDPLLVRTLRYFDGAVAEEAARLKAEAEAAPRPRTAEDFEREAAEQRELEDWVQAVREGRDVPMPARIAAAGARLQAQRRAA
jgi:hypothetical protein